MRRRLTNRQARQRQARGARLLLLGGCGRPERQRRPRGRSGLGNSERAPNVAWGRRGDNRSMTPTDAQQQPLLEQLRRAGDEALPFTRLHAAGVTFPAAVVSELELNGYVIRRVYERGRLVGVRLLESEPPSLARRRAGADRTDSQLRYISRTADCPRLGLAFVRRRLSLAFRAGFGAEGSARGDVDAVVPVVPADAIARRGVAAQHFLNDTSAGSAAGRLRLRYDALPDLEGHAQFRSLLLYFGSA